MIHITDGILKAIFPLGTITPKTILNVMEAGQHIPDSLKTGKVVQEFYTDSDLQIGNVLNIWGRPIKLVDCDNYTKSYYM